MSDPIVNGWLAFWRIMALSGGKSAAIHPEVGKQLSSARRKILAWLPTGHST
jgi:hypothetical protein